MKILLADDHPLFLEGFELLVSRLDKRATLITISNPKLLLDAILQHPDLDLITLDLSMPSLDGFKVLEWIREQQILVPVVIVSATENLQDIAKIMQAGASGFISKLSQADEMLCALQAVLDGEVYISAELQERLLHLQNHQDFNKLSRRQNDIIKLLARGNSNKKIADNLNISEHTVKSHLQAIFQVLGVSNRTECVCKVEQLGLI